MIPENSKIFVSYPIIGVFVAFVVFESLLVGLIPLSYKNNNSSCQISSKSSNISLLNDNKIQSLSSYENKKIQRKRLHERVNEFNIKNPHYLDKYKKSKDILPVNLNECSELIDPVPGEVYPWYSPRLPDNLKPLSYDIEIFIPEFDIPLYDGYDLISIEVTKPTQYIILHTKLELLLFNGLTDKNGNEISVACAGEFPTFDYLILKLEQPLQPSQSPIKLGLIYIAILPEFDTGVFEFQFGSQSSMIATKFSPTNARQAFPCFDEPGYKAYFNFQIDHPTDTIALFNTPKILDEELVGVNNSIRSVYQRTPQMPVYLIGFTVFTKNEFKFVEGLTNNNIPLRVWARADQIELGFADSALSYSINIYNSLLDLLSSVDSASIPPKIDIFAIPEYPTEAVAHFGLLVVQESKILFEEKQASERDRQNSALILAKNLAEFWFGNFVTFSWWNELWLQEAFANYLKYKAVEEAFPNWQIESQFISDELIHVLINDAYPSSHPIQKNVNSPYEIEELFDEVESSKTTALLRMVEDELNQNIVLSAMTNYLNAHPWGVGDIEVFFNKLGNINKWRAKDFFERWTKQPNYPLLEIRLVNEPDGSQSIKVSQSRALSIEFPIFDLDQLYPSDYNFIWYVPLTCSFGTGPSNNDRSFKTTFYIDTKDFTSKITNNFGTKYRWVHCNRKFTGYYITDYTNDNWEILGQALKAKNNGFIPEDRANIIHNLFFNAYINRTPYKVVRDVLTYLTTEIDYVPWRTIHKHLNDLIKILEYKKSFLPLSNFFISEMRNIELESDLWKPTGIHIEELIRETIIDLACRLQDKEYLTKATELWKSVGDSFINGNYDQELLPPFVREVVFNYHMQNTYNLNDWRFLFLNYELNNDLNEKRKYLESLTFSKLPWLLARFLESRKNGGIDKSDFFEAIRLLSKNTLGRDLIWNYIRANYAEIIITYGLDDTRLGQMLLDITSTFADEFLYEQLLDFLKSIPSGTNEFARLRALELVQFNFYWLNSKENEIIEAFSSPRLEKFIKPRAKLSNERMQRNINLKINLENSYRELFMNISKNK